jgi:Family of unknown function (DUF6350)
MNRRMTSLFSALEALLVVGIGIGIPLVPLTIMWAVQYGLQIDWVVFWRASVDIWLAGSGADIIFTLEPAVAAAVGFPEATPFPVTIAPLGLALLTVLLGVRAGRRIAETPYRMLGLVVSIATFGVLALVVTLTALHPLARPSIVQGTLAPTLAFALGALGGARPWRRQADERRPLGIPVLDRMLGWLRDWFATRNDRGERLAALRDPHTVAWVSAAIRAGAASAAAVIAVASVLVAGLLMTSYAQVIALYESVHGGLLGGITLTAGQLAFLPNVVIWAAAWILGPGFAIGTGSSVTPLGTSLGPVPAIPMLGALPTGDLSFGFLGLLVPILAGYLIGAMLRPRLVRALGDDFRQRWLCAAGAGAGIVAGILLGLLAAVSSGSAGPGRLVEVGPNPLFVGLVAALEIGTAVVLGLLAAGVTRRVREMSAR